MKNRQYRDMLRRHIQAQKTWLEDSENFSEAALTHILMHLCGLEIHLNHILERLGGTVGEEDEDPYMN